MPFDIGETINYFADAVLRAPIVKTVAKNPIYTALTITFVVMLIILFIFRDVDTEEPLFVMCLRSGFWISLMLLGVLFLQNKVLVQEVSAATKNAEYDDVFTGHEAARLITPESVVPVPVTAHLQ